MLRLSTITALLVLSLSCAIAVQPDADDLARQFLEAYNTGSVDALTRFFAQHSGEDPARAAKRARWVYGVVWQPIRRVRLESVADRSETKVVLLVQSRLTEARYRFEIEKESTGVSFGFENAEGPPEAAAPISPSAAIQELNSYVDRLCGVDVFSGVVLLARKGAPALERACGFAERETGRSNTLETRFNLGSATKMFTATAVLRLVEQGRVDLTDAVGKHLPSFANEHVRQDVTLAHLLTHTSGMGSYFTEEYRSRKRNVGSIKDLMPFIEPQPLEFAPGTRYAYSNAGFVLLGRVIEAVTATDFYTFVESAVFDPAGMRNTDWPAVDEDQDSRALGYTFAREDGDIGTTRQRNDFVHAMRGSPAGSSYSTARDLLAFDRAIRNAAILSSATAAELLKPRVETDHKTRYAYGFGTRETRAGRVAGHNGHHHGISAQFDMYLDTGWTVVVLSNYDPPAATVVAAKIQRTLERIPSTGM